MISSFRWVHSRQAALDARHQGRWRVNEGEKL
jgi:hypothetical protein